MQRTLPWLLLFLISVAVAFGSGYLYGQVSVPVLFDDALPARPVLVIIPCDEREKRRAQTEVY